MSKENIFCFILLLLIIVVDFAKQCYNSYLGKNYYQICDGKHDYYTEKYEYDSSNNTIEFIDVNGKEITVYGSASITSPKATAK